LGGHNHNVCCHNHFIITFHSDYYGVTDVLIYVSQILELESVSNKYSTVAIGIIRHVLQFTSFGGQEHNASCDDQFVVITFHSDYYGVTNFMM